MRQAGTLSHWKDDKGFGFITPAATGAKVFVHASAFGRGARPAVGDRLTYEVVVDPAKGPRARDVRFADAGRA
jgi:cold shock CspA family protein